MEHSTFDIWSMRGTQQQRLSGMRASARVCARCESDEIIAADQRDHRRRHLRAGECLFPALLLQGPHSWCPIPAPMTVISTVVVYALSPMLARRLRTRVTDLGLPILDGTLR